MLYLSVFALNFYEKKRVFIGELFSFKCSIEISNINLHNLFTFIWK